MKIYFSNRGSTPFSDHEKKKLCDVFLKNEITFVKENSYDAQIIASYPDYLPVTELDKYPNLAFIQLYSAGYDSLNLEYLANRNIKLATTSGAAAIGIAEYVVGTILALNHDLFKYYDQQKEAHWKRSFTAVDLNGKIAGILGTGALGRGIAKRLKSFGVHTIGYRTTQESLPFFDEIYTTSIELKKLFSFADYIIVALPLNKNSVGLIDENLLNKLKQTAVIVNVARGELIDEKALITALENNKIRAVILDVTNLEPLPRESSLWSLPNVYLTPHISFYTTSYMERIITILINNITAYLANLPIINKVLL